MRANNRNIFVEIDSLGGDYVTGGVFNTSTGEVTLTRFSGGTVVYDLDGRYSLTGHTHTLSGLTDTELSATTHGYALIYNSGTTKWEASEQSGIGGGGTDDYLTGGTFNISTGDLDLNLQSGSTVTINLDNRYALTGATPSAVWSAVTTTTAVAAYNGKYIADNASRVVFSLPTDNNLESIRITGKGVGGWQVDVPGSWTINFTGQAVTDNLQSSDASDSIELLGIGDNVYQVISSIGNITFNNL